MLKLSYQKIAQLCANAAVFDRGLYYYNRGAVKKLHANEDLDHVEALVQGTRKYHVEIFEGHQSINYHCSCEAFANYEGFCKHIVAVLLALSVQNPVAYYKSDAEVLMSDLLDTYALQASADGTRKEVELGLNLQIVSPGFYNVTPQAYVSLNIGERGSRKYVVRNIGTLIAAVVEKEHLYFGKRFSYDPLRHYFSPGSSGMLDFFIRIYEIEEQTSPMDRTDTLKGKKLKLSPHLFRRLLEGLGEQPFTFQFGNGDPIESRVALTGFPLQLALQGNAKELNLKLADADEIELLTNEGDIVFYREQIYNLANTEQAALIPLLHALMNRGNGSLQISAAQEQHFFSGIYPVLEKMADLELAPAVKERLYRPPLEANIYLDYDSGRVVARLEYLYGEIRLNPFDPATMKQNGCGEKGLLLIRDSESEHEVMRFFEEAAFTVRDGAMHLEEEEQIWTFIFETIPRIQEHAAIFYSERFKQAGRKSPRFTGQVGIDWNLDLLELEFGLEGVSPRELAEIWQSLRIKRKYHRLRDGSLLPLEGEGIEQFSRLVSALELQPADLKQKTVRLPKYNALYLDGLIGNYGIASLKKSAELADLVSRIHSPAATDFPLPPPLEGILRDYQATGFKWLKSLADCGFGGILADDMGLGKTVQAIAFILSERQKGLPKPPPTLVVAPASLIYNWEAEIKRFAPELKALIITGTKEERRKLLGEVNKVDVVITSYPLIRRDITLYASLSFSCCFLDEAQYIKNPNSQTAQCARRIKARQRFALTGTPIENSLIELWSIFQFIMPGYLQSQKKFLQKYRGNVSAAEPDNQREEAIPLAVKVRPFILRRLKEEVLRELPPKIEHRYLSELTLDQKKLYRAYLEQLRSKTSESLLGSSFERSRIQILAGLMRLRQICCHPSLFVENYRGESAKLLQLQELLSEAIKGGHRILLFSQFTGMLHLIKSALDKEGYRYFYLDGATKTEKRLQMVDSFNSGEKEIFLISLKAGGTGLNLTGADIVIQYDLWWNPAVEEQAAGRAHRIGQKKVVQVIRLLAKDTIEEKICELQQKKKELIDGVIRPGETFLSSMSESDIREILEI